MLIHNNNFEELPSRVVVIGARGFVGSSLVNNLILAGIDVLPLGRQDIDLLDENSIEQLVTSLTPEDSVVFISAEAPVKNNKMLERNISMASTLCAALKKVIPKHVIYVSSDAVYADSMELLNEHSCAQPGSLHGVMHLTREVMIRESYQGKFGIIRPTLIYGLEDPHNGYGPNRFRRLVEKNEDIVLFGNGEELRDHVFVKDVAQLIVKMLLMNSEGILNAATGTVTSFHQLAELIQAQYKEKTGIVCTERTGPMPHNGYRAFNPENTLTAFPNFSYTDINTGLSEICNGEKKSD